MAKKVAPKSGVAGVKTNYAGTKSKSTATPAPAFKKGGTKKKC